MNEIEGTIRDHKRSSGERGLAAKLQVHWLIFGLTVLLMVACPERIVSICKGFSGVVFVQPPQSEVPLHVIVLGRMGVAEK